jgi:N-acetylglucosamine kinase-like BadF-type ATPase
MEYVLGIESGGTKTIAQLARRDGTIVARASGPSIADVVPKPELVRQTFRAILDDLDTPVGIQAVYISLGGLNLPTVEQVGRELLPTAIVEVQRESSGDVVCGCAPWWGFDIAVMVGTGTVALGRAADGRCRKVGGWGWWIEDPGSGFEIGRDALRAVTRMLDFGEPQTALLSAFVRHELFRESLGALPAEALIQADLVEEHRDEITETVKSAYPHLDRRSISSFCPLVEDCANAGDPVARAILQDAGRRAADYALQLAHYLDLGAPRVIPMGSVLLNAPLVLSAFRETILGVLPAATVEGSDFTLATGAVLRALELAGVRISPAIVRQLRTTAGDHDV